MHNWEFKFRGLGSFSAIRYPARAKSKINCGGGREGVIVGTQIQMAICHANDIKKLSTF